MKSRLPVFFLVAALAPTVLASGEMKLVTEIRDGGRYVIQTPEGHFLYKPNFSRSYDDLTVQVNDQGLRSAFIFSKTKNGWQIRVEDREQARRPLIVYPLQKPDEEPFERLRPTYDHFDERADKDKLNWSQFKIVSQGQYHAFKSAHAEFLGIDREKKSLGLQMPKLPLLWMGIKLRQRVDTFRLYEVFPPYLTQSLKMRVGCIEVSAGNFSTRGTVRREMEDEHSISNANGTLAVAVFDGHGGSKSAEIVAEDFHAAISDVTNRRLSKSVLRQVVAGLEEKLLATLPAGDKSGTTLTSAFIQGKDLYVANVGDSRTVLASKGQAIALSQDHKPDRPDEKQRIEAAGGAVNFLYGAMRTYPSLIAMSRSLGDKQAKGDGTIIADPEIEHRVVSDEDEFLIVACDGLWDVFSNQDAVDYVGKLRTEEKIQDPQVLAKRLTEAAITKGSRDNVTVVIALFNR